MVFQEKKTIIFIVAVLAVFLAANYPRSSPRKHVGVVYSLPLAIGAWQGSEVSYDSALLTSWLGTQDIVFRAYRNEKTGQVVTLYIAYYPDLEASDMAHAPEVCYPGQGWSIGSNENINYTLLRKQVSIKRMSIEKNSEREVVYSWWQDRDQVIAGNTWYHLKQMLKRLYFQDTSSIWVRVSAENASSGKNINPGEDAVRSFCTDAAPLLSHYFKKGG